MPKFCLILSDNPTVRLKLRAAIEKLGFETLEAAGVERGRQCLAQKPEAILVVNDASKGDENLINVLKNLPPPRTKGRPAVIGLGMAISQAGGIPEGADMVRSLDDIIDPSSLKLFDAFKQLGVL